MAWSSTSCLHMSWVDLRLLPGVARPCRAGVPNAEPGAGAPAAPRGAALILSTAQFGNAEPDRSVGAREPVSTGVRQGA